MNSSNLEHLALKELMKIFIYDKGESREGKVQGISGKAERGR